MTNFLEIFRFNVNEKCDIKKLGIQHVLKDPIVDCYNQ